MIASRSFKLGINVCAYCGVAIATTKDHVISRNLWPDDERNGVKFIRVPACLLCNGQKSKVDNFLRDYLVIDEDRSCHPLAAKLISNGTIERAVQGKHVKILRSFEDGVVLPRVTPAGIIWGAHYGIPLDQKDWEQIAEAVDYVSRGLYWVVTGEAMTSDMAVSSRLIPRVDRVEALKRFGHISRIAQEFHPEAGNWIEIGDVYSGFMAAAPGGMYWYHVFYNGVTLLSRIGPIASSEEAPTVEHATLDIPTES